MQTALLNDSRTPQIHCTYRWTNWRTLSFIPQPCFIVIDSLLWLIATRIVRGTDDLPAHPRRLLMPSPDAPITSEEASSPASPPSAHTPQ